MKTRAKSGSARPRRGKGIATRKAIGYVSQPRTTELIKEKSAFVEWTEAEQARLRSQPGDFAKAYAAFRKEQRKRSQALLALEQEAHREKGERKDRFGFGYFGRPRGVPDVLPLQHQDQGEVAFEAAEPAMFGYIDYQLTPFRTQVYSGSPAFPSSLMEPCPDLEHWSAWLANDEVALSQQCRLWFPGGRYTGGFLVSPRVTVEGLVDIGAGGKVSVGADCGVAFVWCTHKDRDHDNGWHYDPAYDTLVRLWRSVCMQPHPPLFVDTQPGLHTFTHDSEYVIAIGFDLLRSYGGPGRFIDIAQYVSITAENAVAQFGPGAGSGQTGWIRTPFPTVRLQRYQGPTDVQRVAADGFPWGP
jgi:hypothetical protein